MRISTFFLIVFLVLLSSCAKNTESVIPVSPYPSTPLWVSSETLLRSSEVWGSSYIATGNEPFWSVDVTPGKAVYSIPGGEDGKTQDTTFDTVEDDKSALIVIRWIKGDFFLNLIKTSCNDGMSDKTYAYKATLLVWGDTLEGCADKK